MLKKINDNFWFWTSLCFINLVSISMIMKTEDRISISITACVFVFCLAKALKCASNLENNEG